MCATHTRSTVVLLVLYEGLREEHDTPVCVHVMCIVDPSRAITTTDSVVGRPYIRSVDSVVSSCCN